MSEELQKDYDVPEFLRRKDTPLEDAEADTESIKNEWEDIPDQTEDENSNRDIYEQDEECQDLDYTDAEPYVRDDEFAYQKSLNDIQEDVKPKKKKIPPKVRFIIEGIIVGLAVIAFIVINLVISKKNSFIVTDIDEYECHIDTAKLKDDVFMIDGWCYKKEINTPPLDSEEANNFKIYLLRVGEEIKSEEDLEKFGIEMNTVRTERMDVQEAFGKRTSAETIQYCGFEASIPYDNRLTHDYYIGFLYGEKGDKIINTKHMVFIRNNITFLD